MRDETNINTAQSTTGGSTPPEFGFLRERFGESVLSFHLFRGDLVIDILPSSIVEIARSLRDLIKPSYNHLSFITAEHWIEGQTPKPLTPPAFQVIYGLQTIPSGKRLRLTLSIPDAPESAVPSLTNLHESANWHEREIFDLFGIKFSGHPNLKRILTPDDFEFHPLRRDFPHGGPELMEYHDHMMAKWNVASERDYLGKFGDPWIQKVVDQQEGWISLKRLSDRIEYEKEVELPGDIAREESIEQDIVEKPKLYKK